MVIKNIKTTIILLLFSVLNLLQANSLTLRSFSLPVLQPEQPANIFDANMFGLVADGHSDDGPVIQRLISKAKEVDGAVKIQFPSGKKIFLSMGSEDYIFNLKNYHNLTIDGGGSIFLVDIKKCRFIWAEGCNNLRIQNMIVDCVPAPMVESTVLKVFPDNKTVIVKLDDISRVKELGGPTGLSDEQSFFGLLWLTGKYVLEWHHFGVTSATPIISDSGEAGWVKVETCNNLKWDEIAPGKTRLSLPVPGIAHRRGPGNFVKIEHCNNVALIDLDIWSSPWMAYGIHRNSGDLIFKNANIRAEPGSARLASSCRDGYHVKGNSANILWEDCRVTGCGDDSFNIASHTSSVVKKNSPTHITLAQNFPIQYMPLKTGGELLFLSKDSFTRVGSSVIKSIVLKIPENPSSARLKYPPLPLAEIELEEPLDNVSVGNIAWDLSTCNPNSILKNCIIDSSCRFRGPVLIENSEFSAFVWITGGDRIEGPIPHNVVLKNNVFKQGKGNPIFALAAGLEQNIEKFSSRNTPEAYPLQNIIIENNRFYGSVKLQHINGIIFRNNSFMDGAQKSFWKYVNKAEQGKNTPDMTELFPYSLTGPVCD